MAIFNRRGRKLARLELELESAMAQLTEVPGAVVPSPFAQLEEARSLVPWHRRRGALTPAEQIAEAAPARVPQPRKVPQRSGFLEDIPRGGASETNQGYYQVGGSTDRKTGCEQLQRLYLSCVWSSACVDSIARTSSAGGLLVVPNNANEERRDLPTPTGAALKAQELIEYVNPVEDIRQLLRGIFTDLLIYGDSFVEVCWLMNEPVALYSLPCQDMLIDADEHGSVRQYVQVTDTGRRAYFQPHEVIHFQFDNPRGGLYGLGPTEKTIFPITTWLFTTGLLKSTMARGNPPNVAFKWDVNLSENEIKKFSQQYLVRNIGPANVGNPIDLIGDTAVHEFAQAKIEEYINTRNQARDEILAGYGVPPAKASIIEAGSLGGGTGTSQDKTFKVNTCGPIEELVLEKLTFHLLQQGFGVLDHRFKFEQIDWRDDQIVENIRDTRIRNGTWTINRGRDDINEPPVDGGDDPVIIERTGMVLVKDLGEMSKATISRKGQNGDSGIPTQADGQPIDAPTPPPVAPPVTGRPKEKGEAADDDELLEDFAREYIARREQMRVG